jgi:hypothetical protein
VTADEAVAKTATMFDEIAGTALTDAEAMLRNRGASDEELGLELERMRSETAKIRHRALQQVRAFVETGVWSIQ